MLNKKFSPERQTAFDARYEAQKIVFGPAVFQCVRYAWKRGMLKTLSQAGNNGLTVDELASMGKWTKYALKVVLETCLSAGVVYLKEGKYLLDRAGYCVLNDRITQINLDFIHEVCYQGLFELDSSLDEEKPLGLKHFGDWPSLYEGLQDFPDSARESWLEFDQFYSDISFPDIMPDVFATNPKKIMDIGANTGKFSQQALAYNDTVEIILLDLPQQLAVAQSNLDEQSFHDRVHLFPIDLLNTDAAFPSGVDIVWMSQLLSCFSEEMISSIMARAANALTPGGHILIMDTLWDRQRYDIASYCLINTSPYFTAIASGNSKIYESGDYIRLCEATGLKLLTIRDNIGFCHSLLRFTREENLS